MYTYRPNRRVPSDTTIASGQSFKYTPRQIPYVPSINTAKYKYSSRLLACSQIQFPVTRKSISPWCHYSSFRGSLSMAVLPPPYTPHLQVCSVVTLPSGNWAATFLAWVAFIFIRTRLSLASSCLITSCFRCLDTLVDVRVIC